MARTSVNKSRKASSKEVLTSLVNEDDKDKVSSDIGSQEICFEAAEEESEPENDGKCHIDWSSVVVENGQEEEPKKAKESDKLDESDSLFIYRKYGLVKDNKADWKLYNGDYYDNKNCYNSLKTDIFNKWDDYEYCDDSLFEKREKKTIGVLYSGGIDSTLCILKALDEGNIVQPIMMRFNDLMDEFLTILNLHILHTRFKGRIKKPIWTLDMSTSFSNNSMNLNGGIPTGYIQQPSAAFALATVNCDRFNISEIWAGYIRNDDVLSYKDEWYAIYNNAWKFTHGVMGSNLEPTKVIWPLMKSGKDTVIFDSNALKRKYDLHLVDTSCERLSYTYFVNEKEKIIKIFVKDCGDCHKCKLNHVYNIADITRIITFKYENDLPEEMKPKERPTLEIKPKKTKAAKVKL